VTQGKGSDEEEATLEEEDAGASPQEKSIREQGINSLDAPLFTGEF